jgi:hypothetical protein
MVITPAAAGTLSTIAKTALVLALVAKLPLLIVAPGNTMDQYARWMNPSIEYRNAG